MPRSKKGITHRLPKPHPETRRWRLRIGLAHAQDDPRRHVEKVFWWPRDCNEGEMPPPSIIADAVAKQDQWRQIEKDWPIRPITVEQAVDEYLADQRKRIDLKAGNGIRTETYRGLHDNLLGAFGLSTGKERTRLRDTTIDPAENLTAINRERLMGFARFWQRLPEGVDSSRTVKNYFSAVRSFLRWCEVQDE